ncbi:MAG: DNA primase [Paludibacteraceae bacterium]|nr:DNA primase [Paludibacteraceae bacterium]
MIDQATVDRIFDAAQIVDVVSDYVTLHRRGANYTGLCPFHDEKTPSFSVSPAKNIYKCFGCGKGGNPINFVMELENLSYYEALKFLAKKYHIDIQEEELSAEQIAERTERESMMAVTEWAQQHFTHNLFETQEGQSIGMSYFSHRGFHEDTIRKFQLGYALDKRDAYTVLAQEKGFKRDYLEKVGLTIVKDNNYAFDRFHGRAMFPIHSISGKVIGFGGRTLKKDDQVKYQNSPESDIYHKGNVLYGIFFAKNAIIKEKKCYIVEGYADVLSMVQAGVQNIVAPCGTALTVEQIRLLRRIVPSVDADRLDGNKNVTMLYDGDSAGVHAALKNGKLLLQEGLNAKVVVLPPEDDPDTFAQNHDSSYVLQYLAEQEQDYIIFKTNYLLKEANGDPIKKAQTITEMAQTIAVISDQVKRSVYISECAKILGVEESLLHTTIAQKRWEQANANPQPSNPISEAQRVPVAPPDDLFNPDNEPAGTPQKSDLGVASNSSVNLADYAKERELIYYLVRYGEREVLRVSNEGQEVVDHVVTYLVSELEMDDLHLEHPVYAKMLRDFHEAFNSGTLLTAQQFFMRSMDSEVTAIASDLLSDRYQLSRMYDKHCDDNKIKVRKMEREEDERLTSDLPRVMCEFKFYCVQQEMAKCLKMLQTSADEEARKESMSRYMAYQRAKQELAKILGERIIK